MQKVMSFTETKKKKLPSVVKTALLTAMLKTDNSEHFLSNKTSQKAFCPLDLGEIVIDRHGATCSHEKFIANCPKS